MRTKNKDTFSRCLFLNNRVLPAATLLVGLLLAFEATALAQASTSSMPGGGSRRAFTLFGDLKITGTAEGQRDAIFDIVLYTRGNEIFSRQRVSNGGRYRFNNIFNGDYYLAIELDTVEIARMPILISINASPDIRQDLEFQWKARPAGAVVSTRDSFERSGENKALYERASQEIAAKKFAQAIVTLQSLVASDPKDFPAWTDLGMVQFIQKDLVASEKSYLGALAAKPDHLTALINLGRVRIAQKNAEGAVETLEQALKVDATSASANYFLGEAYLALKKGSKAVVHFYEALKLDPVGMADAHLRIGTLYNAAGYKDKAAAEYMEFLKKKPDYPDRKKLEDYIQANKGATETTKP